MNSYSNLSIFTSFLLLSISISISAQSTFKMTIGGAGDERANSIISLPGGGYAIAGYSTSYGNGTQNAYLISLDESFEIEWSRTFGGPNNDRINNITRDVSGGGFLITGQTSSFGSGNNNNLLLGQLNANGESQWMLANGGTRNEAGWGVVQLPNRQLIIAGSSQTWAQTGNGAYLFKTSASGIPLFGKVYDNISPMAAPASDNFRDIILCRSQNYIYLTGMMKLPGRCNLDNQAHNFQLLIMKMDLNGNEIWHTYIGGGNCRENGRALTQTEDGHIVATGLAQSFGGRDDDIYLVKVNSETGELMWTNVIGGTGDELGKDVIATQDGGVALTGWTESTFSGQRDMFLIKTDINGNLEWSRTYGSQMQEEGHSLLQTDDGGFLIAGFTSGFGNGGEDILLVKTDEEGRLEFCDYETINFSQMPGGEVNSGYRVREFFSVSNAVPSETLTQDSAAFIHCCPEANFEYLKGCPNEEVAFINLSEGPITNWNWDFGDGNSSGLESPNHLYNSAGVYQVTLEVEDGAGCKNSLSLTIEISPEPSPLIEGMNRICAGNSAQMTAKPEGYEYLWSTGENTQIIELTAWKDTTISLILTDERDCNFGPVFFSIEVDQPEEVGFGGDTKICPGDTTTLSVFPQSVDILWSTGDTTNSINLAPEFDTQLFVLINQFESCPTDTLHLSLELLEGNFGQISGPSSICAGDTIIFSALPDGLNYLWSTGDSTQSIILTPDDHMELQLEVSNSLCSDTSTTFLQVLQYADLWVETAPITACPGDSVQLLVSSTNCFDFLWESDHLMSCNYCDSPIAYPEFDGIITLSCSSDTVCLSTVYIPVFLDRNPEANCYLCKNTYVYIPNAFSPNDDGVNDRFYVQGKGIDKILNFQIYDRWGNRVFHTQHTEANTKTYGWDGTHHGLDAPPGHYTYSISILCKDRGTQHLAGSITLFR